MHRPKGIKTWSASIPKRKIMWNVKSEFKMHENRMEFKYFQSIFYTVYTTYNTYSNLGNKC